MAMAMATGGGGVPPAAAQAGGGAGWPHRQDGRAVAGRSAAARGPAQGQLVAARAAAQGTHGGGPATAAQDLSGKEDWEHKSGMGMLTKGLVCAKEGQKWFVDGRAELR